MSYEPLSLWCMWYTADTQECGISKQNKLTLNEWYYGKKLLIAKSYYSLFGL